MRSRSILALAFLVLLAPPASAEEPSSGRVAPANLDELVALAVSIDPDARASSLDADAARARSAGARQPMSPELMFGIESFGVPMDDPDPTMWMGGVSQMLPGWGQLRAQSRRFAVEADRAVADRERIAADLRLRLWQSAARIGALQQDLRLLEEQLGESDALRQVALARYRNAPESGATRGAMPGREAMPGDSMEPTSSFAPPQVQASSPASGGMGGMTGMGGGRGSAATSNRVLTPGMADSMGGDAGGGAMSVTGMGMASDAGFPGLLRLDVTVERLRAERSALEARLHGELTVLALFVGTDAASFVAATPSRFRGPGAAAVPEQRLADLDRVAASADVEIARARRRPNLMWSAGVRAMPPHGEFAGVDASVGIALPIWGGLGREVHAGRRALAAAEARQAGIEREIAAAVATARASLEAARSRRRALEAEVLPRAQASYAASRRVYASGSGSIDDALLAWDALIAVKRERVAAERDEELRAAELARVEGQ